MTYIGAEGIGQAFHDLANASALGTTPKKNPTKLTEVRPSIFLEMEYALK
jgi:hypothetical protein